MDLVEAMVHNRATLTMPDISLPGSVGSVKVRMEGFKTFPGLLIDRLHLYHCFIVSIVYSEMQDEIGLWIEVGLWALGPKGILATLKDSTFKDVCWLEEEWVLTWTLRVNREVQDSVPVTLWNLLAKRPPLDSDLVPQCWSVRHPGSTVLLFAKPRRRKQGCTLCQQYASLQGLVQQCDICLAPASSLYSATDPGAQTDNFRGA
eukprot:1484096-Rhodomonas_salina.1